MDGLMLLRSRNRRRILAVTASGDDELRSLAEEYGAAQFISKLVDFNLLKAQLRGQQQWAILFIGNLPFFGAVATIDAA
jgi:DNA-binding response OmpR family regulator